MSDSHMTNIQWCALLYSETKPAYACMLQSRLTPSQFFIPLLNVHVFMLHPVQYVGVNWHSCTKTLCFTLPLSLVMAQICESSNDLYMLFWSCGEGRKESHITHALHCAG